MIRLLSIAAFVVAPFASSHAAGTLSPDMFHMPWLNKQKSYQPSANYKQKPKQSESATAPANSDKKKTKAAAKKSAPKPSSKVAATDEAPDVIEGGPRPNITPRKPAVVKISSGHDKGQIIIDTAARKLYYTLGKGRAYAYPVAVGKEGFQWFGTSTISRKASWPDWRPPEEMRERKPELPKLMTGGLWNPLGSKALYLGSSLYRIHGTANAKSIGQAASSGCFRMHNGHVEHLSRIAGVGTKVIVLKSLAGNVAAESGEPKQSASNTVAGKSGS